MGEGRTIPFALIDLIRGMLWPAVVATALIYFAEPIHQILSTLGRNLSSAQSIDLGYVKITVREAKIAPPEPDVGKALSGLDRTLLATLVDHSTDSGYHICSAPKETFDVERKRKYDKLVELGLVRFDASTSPASNCPGLIQIAWLSDVGKATKAYFNRIVLEQITISNPSPK